MPLGAISLAVLLFPFEHHLRMVEDLAQVYDQRLVVDFRMAIRPIRLVHVHRYRPLRRGAERESPW